jgi:hypothetical protein
LWGAHFKLEERMPKTKNQGKNKSRFEIRGGVLNEYEFALNEGAISEEERNRLTQAEEERALREGEGAEALPSSPPEREAARLREVMETAHEKAQRNIEKRERQAAREESGGARKGSKAAKAGRKASGKKGGKKSAAKASKKSAAKKSGAKGRGAAKKGSKKGARGRG